MSKTVKPQALVVCDRATFGLQFNADWRERLGSLVSLGDPVWTDELDSPSIRRRLKDVEVLITSWGVPHLTADRLAGAPALRAVFHAAGSVRGFESAELWDRGIVVTTAAELNAVPVAEFTLAAIILAGKKVPQIAAQPERYRTGWSHIDGLGDLSNYGRTVGIVGFSRIGRRVVELLHVLDRTNCLVSDPYADPDEVAAAGATLVALPDLLARADILSLHAPELPETKGMIGAEQLAQLPDHATIINTARGALIDTAALETECRSGRLSAILDVTDPEPLPRDSQLYKLPNVMLTPHLAGSMGTETHRLADAALDELERFLSGDEPLAPVAADGLGISA